MATHHVDIEIVGVMNSQLVIRFKVADKHLDAAIQWDGTSDVLEQAKNMARGIVDHVLKPPPPTFQQMLAQVGRQTHVDVAPLPGPNDPPPPLPDLRGRVTPK